MIGLIDGLSPSVGSILSGAALDEILGDGKEGADQGPVESLGKARDIGIHMHFGVDDAECPQALTRDEFGLRDDADAKTPDNGLTNRIAIVDLHDRMDINAGRFKGTLEGGSGRRSLGSENHWLTYQISNSKALALCPRVIVIDDDHNLVTIIEQLMKAWVALQFGQYPNIRFKSHKI